MHDHHDQNDDPLSHVERAKSHLDELAASATSGIAAGLVSHEVRNLLTPAIAYVQLALREPSLHPGTQRALMTASVAMRRACEVSELVLACYRSTPDMPAHATSNVAAVLDECVSALGLEQPASALVLIRDVPQTLEVAIPTEALRHVLLNLILNAQASLQPSGGAISISGSTSNAGEVSTLTIRDTGRGIPADQLRRLNRELGGKDADSTGARSRGSGGLGLVLCRHLLEPYGAQLALDSMPGQGTSATVTFHTPNASRHLQAA